MNATETRQRLLAALCAAGLWASLATGLAAGEPAAEPAAGDARDWNLAGAGIEVQDAFRLAVVPDDGPDCRLGLPPEFPPSDWKGGHLPVLPAGPPSHLVLETAFMVSNLGPDSQPALYCGAASYPFELYLNGQLVLRHGRHAGAVYNSNSFSGLWVSLDPALLKAGEPNVLVMVAWPRGETSPLDTIRLTDQADATGRAFWKTFFETNLVQGAAACALMMGLYFVILMLFGRKKDWRYLFFALLCFCFVLAYSNMIFNYRSSDQLGLEKLSRAVFPFTVGALVLFVLEFTAPFRRRRWIWLAIGLAAAAGALAIVVQPDIGMVGQSFSLVMN
jgi:hypothetical protein